MAARYEVDDEEAPARDDDLDWESTITFMVDRETTRATRLGAVKRHRPFRGSVQVPRMPLDQFCKLLHHDPRRARLSDDAFHSRYGYGYDAVLALRHDDDADGGRLSAKAREIVKKLHGGGVETRLERASRGRKVLFVLLRAPVHRLAHAADQLDWIVPLCPAAVERRITRGAEGIKPRTLHHDPKLTHGRGPYVLIHGKYDTDEGLQALYDAPRGCAHLFEWSLLRLKLLFAILEMPHRQGGCGLSVKAQVEGGDFLAAYPLHDRARRELASRWSMHAPRLDLVRSYFGERLALYFAFATVPETTSGTPRPAKTSNLSSSVKSKSSLDSEKTVRNLAY